ncbi:MAG: asparagine synthase [Xanthomonadales bacterium]|nr:asparagine synthase [Xanthomonadales bacterium]
MASFLIWWSPEAKSIDDCLWDRMVAEVMCRPQSKNQAPIRWDLHTRYVRAVAVRTLSCEPDPYRHIAPDIEVFAALRYHLCDRELAGRRFTEPAALARVEDSARRLTLTRDLLGHRHLVWTRVSGGILASTREEPLLIHPEVSPVWNDSHIAAMLAQIPPEDTSTPFQQIFSIAPGMTAEFTPKGMREFRERFEPCEDVAGCTDTQLANRFRDLLQDSVYRAACGANRIGLSISSGLDAASIAAVLMQQHKSPVVPVGVCYGYRTEDGADIDERVLAAQLCQRLGIEFVGIDASSIPLSFTLDGGWNSPIGAVQENPYREIKSEVYRRLADHGADVVLVGHGADQFAMMPANWIWSAWANKRYDWIIEGLRSYLRHRGLWGTLRHPSIRRLVKYLLQGRTGLMRSIAPPELPTCFRDQWMEARTQALSRLSAWPDPSRAAEHFNAFESADYALEVPNAEHYGLDIRSPYRDWNLVRFVLSTPTFLMAGPIGYKWLLKRAAAPFLDSQWINRPKFGDLSPLWKRNYDRRRAQIAERLPRLGRWVDQYFSPNSSFGINSQDGYRLTQLNSFLSWAESPLQRE